MKAAKFKLLLTGLLILFSCAARMEKNDSRFDEDELRSLYARAIEDAKVAEPCEIWKELTAITPFNEKLIRNNKTGEILVVTWTSWKGYEKHIGDEMELTREVWVTVVPELKNFMEKLHGDEFRKYSRIEQLLGLPPNDGKTLFVEMWVSPGDLFRPSPDPEISDGEAELDFPISESFIKVKEEYRLWYENMRETSYGKEGYPWTRLGYTYDWGNRESEIGLSEFVIKKGAKVRIAFIYENSQYGK